jgi:hypothetical protein
MNTYRRIGGSCWLDLQDMPMNGSKSLWKAHYRLPDFTSRSRKHQSSLFFSQNVPRYISLLVIVIIIIIIIIIIIFMKD